MEAFLNEKSVGSCTLACMRVCAHMHLHTPSWVRNLSLEAEEEAGRGAARGQLSAAVGQRLGFALCPSLRNPPDSPWDCLGNTLGTFCGALSSWQGSREGS